MNKKIVVIAPLLLIFAIGGWLLYKNDSENASENDVAETSETSEVATSADIVSPDDTQEFEETTDEPEADEPNKQTPVTVSEKPLIFTGFGHSETRPLPNGQQTSTTCTTDANVECTITLSNTSTDEVFSFDTMTTDGQGVAIWSWTGGEDVSSGTWELTATAGDKTSDVETIYVE